MCLPLLNYIITTYVFFAAVYVVLTGTYDVRRKMQFTKRSKSVDIGTAERKKREREREKERKKGPANVKLKSANSIEN